MKINTGALFGHVGINVFLLELDSTNVLDHPLDKRHLIGFEEPNICFR